MELAVSLPPMVRQLQSVGTRSPQHWRDAALVHIVEDDRPQLAALRSALVARGYRVESSETAREALANVEQLHPDIVLLDLGLPDMAGMDAVRHLLLRVRCPLIVVTADEFEDHMVEALDMGAADYVLKPFSIDVLLARLRRVLRHASAVAAVVDKDVIELGDVRIDLGAHQVFVAGRPADLPARQFELLTIIARNEGLLLTYAALARALFGYTTADTNPNALRMAVTRIRKQIGTGPNRPVIETAARVGYRLIAPSRPHGADPRRS
jgi:two-component system KDP operon response regulator KdpE